MKDVKIFTDLIDEKATNQVHEIANIYNKEKIRIMPDVHPGIGSVIGFTCDITHSDKIIPNIVGVDIGCGVTAWNLGNIKIDLESLDNFIRNNIPHGFNVHSNSVPEVFVFTQLRCYKYLIKKERLQLSLGSLGGGNHFIEVEEASNGDKWLVVHSGSRNLGNQIAKYYQELAHKKTQQRHKEKIDNIIKNTHPQKREEKLKSLPKNKLNKDLAFLQNEDMEDYLHDMTIACFFASRNRRWILKLIREHLTTSSPIDVVESVHNYIELFGSKRIIRKGAIRSNLNEKLIIPINMRDGVIIGLGKGNKDWNNSAPHGAGRLLGRREAKKTLDMVDYINSMQGVYTTSVNEQTLDEAPMVYKPIESIIDNIKDTVEIIEVLKPIYNFKSN